jgi:hypothetical protein
MTTKYIEILKLYDLGYSKSKIAESLQCARNTVISTIQKAKSKGIDINKLEQLSNDKIVSIFDNRKYNNCNKFSTPNFNIVRFGLAKKNGTLKKEWEKYTEACFFKNEKSLQYQRFCELYKIYASKFKATMHVDHKPGLELELDWAGGTIPIQDSETGVLNKAYIFVATLPYSCYFYAEAFLSRKVEYWIKANINAFNFFGGTTQILRPDNLKTAIIRGSAKNSFPTLNKLYEEMAMHYKSIVMPARVRKPQDKAHVEQTVKHISISIIEPLRNQTFFSISELNNEIKKLVTFLNNKPFQKREGSRFSDYELEKEFLRPLPPSDYEYSVMLVRKVPSNYHIMYDYVYYSVPYIYIKKSVILKISSDKINIFYEGILICSHDKKRIPKGSYITDPIHMPKKHQNYGHWDKEKLLNWALIYGQCMEKLIKQVLEKYEIEQQAYKSCFALLNYAKNNNSALVEMTAEYIVDNKMPLTLSYFKQTYDFIEKHEMKQLKDTESTSDQGFIRGSQYFDKNEEKK